jgi:hypothetical protein
VDVDVRLGHGSLAVDARASGSLKCDGQGGGDIVESAQPMGRANTRNPLAQPSSLTSPSPVVPFPVVLSSFLATIAIVLLFLSVGASR